MRPIQIAHLVAFLVTKATPVIAGLLSVSTSPDEKTSWRKVRRLLYPELRELHRRLYAAQHDERS